VYAIAFDLDTEGLERLYGSPHWRNAYEDIRRIFVQHGFERQQGSVYFGNDRTTPVNCVLAVQEASRRYAWFRHVVTDIRMLRIEENNDLYPALGEPELPFGPQAPEVLEMHGS
jgi:virulence-associated protein VapD